jgi:hypothetical protein
MNNIRSYKGPPLTNKLPNLTASSASGGTYVLTASSEIVDIPTVGSTNVTVCNLQNTGASWCCVNFMSFGNGGNIITGSTLYTYLLLYRVDSGYTHPNFMYRYEFNSSGTYLTESGIFDTSKRTYLGNGWYYAWNTFTTQPTTTNMQCYSFSYNYSNYTDKYSWAKVAIVQGDYSGLYPSYWPNVNSTNSTILQDISGNNIMDVSGSALVYSNSKITFPNINSAYIGPTDPSKFRTGTSSFTMSAWVKQLDNGSNVLVEARGYSLIGYFFVLNYPSAGQISVFLNSSSNQSVYASSISTLGYGTVQNIVAVVDRGAATIYLYVNGSLWNTITGIHSGSISPSGEDMYRMGYDRGGGTANMEVYEYAHYSRALSASEIQQNFNAHRGRYGL